ncbi:hypothetical protein [Microbacterium sp. YY-01]|uniref:hypothetical protein n=1 Tax=Microbacterium sp. YY-01 TaxID=3421634 RepID=UPI003D16F395
MSDELQIHRGSAIAVNSDEVRAVATSLGAQASRLSGIASDVRRIPGLIDHGGGESAGVSDAAWQLEAIADHAQEATAQAVTMADAYEIAELRATISRLPEGDETNRLQEQLDALVVSNPDAALFADRAKGIDDIGGLRFSPSLLAFGLLPAVLAGPALKWGMAFVRDKNRGRVEDGDYLKAHPSTVTVDKRGVRSVNAPTTVSEAFQRIQHNNDGQISIDVIDLPGGEREYFVYIDGTSSLGIGGNEPWDMVSNVQLYVSQEESDSYHAVLQALDEVGAEPGDTLNLVSYSQGAAVAASIEASGDYNVAANFMAGSPIAPPASDALHVSLAHTNDVIAQLSTADGDGTGSDDSLVISRTIEPNLVERLPATPFGPWTTFGPHMLDKYVDTAHMAEDSGDPRMAAVAAYLQKYADAGTVHNYTFNATRQ